MLPSAVINQLASIKIDADSMALYMMQQPQAPCPVSHSFGPQIYIRSVSFKAGDFLIGHAHKAAHTVMVMRGRAVVLGDMPREIDATKGPVLFVGGTEKKVVFCLEDCEWANVFQNPDDCRDIETLEDRYLDKSWSFNQLESLAIDAQEDRDDYIKALADLGWTEEQAVAISERDELAETPDEYLWRISVRNSPIHGKGLFLSSPAKEGEVIAPATVNGIRTVAGKYVNHSASPNCKYVRMAGETYLMTTRDVFGAFGGSPGEELTVDYRQSVKLSMETLQ